MILGSLKARFQRAFNPPNPIQIGSYIIELSARTEVYNHMYKSELIK